MRHAIHCGPRGRMHHHHGWGSGPASPGFGAGGRRGRRGRGDVRAAILLLLEGEPRNGYGLMQEVEQRSSGAWRPSPGSIYPALAQLEDEGFIAPAPGEQGKTFALTDAGRAHVEEHRDHIGVPWQEASAGMPAGLQDLRKAAAQLRMASMMVAQTGDPELLEGARVILEDARRALYRLLAGDDEPGER